MTSSILEFCKFLWLLPITILVWLFYVLPLWAVGEIEYEGKADTFIWIFLNPIDPDSVYDKAWAKWAGQALPCAYIYAKHTTFNGPLYDQITKIHEVKHCKDQLLFGPFFYLGYAGHSTWLGVSNLWKKEEDKRHIYHENFLEVRARKAAGQRAVIPRDEWMDGPKDYNPWL